MYTTSFFTTRKEVSMVTTIKRETFRSHYYMVARVDGKVEARKRWGAKSSDERINKTLARSLFNQVRSFNPDERIHRLSSQTDTLARTDFSKRPTRKRGKDYQVVVEGIVRQTGKTITASSQQHPSRYPQRRAKEEAFTNFYRRLAQYFGYEYEEGKGKSLEDKLSSLRWGIQQFYT